MDFYETLRGDSMCAHFVSLEQCDDVTKRLKALLSAPTDSDYSPRVALSTSHLLSTDSTRGPNGDSSFLTVGIHNLIYALARGEDGVAQQRLQGR